MRLQDAAPSWRAVYQVAPAAVPGSLSRPRQLTPHQQAGQLVSNWQPTGRAISMRQPPRFLALSRMLPGIQGGAIYMRHPPRPGRVCLAPSRPRQLAPHQQGGAAPGCCPPSIQGRAVSMRQHPRPGRYSQASTGSTPPTGRGGCGVPKTGTSVGLILRAGAREAPGCCHHPGRAIYMRPPPRLPVSLVLSRMQPPSRRGGSNFNSIGSNFNSIGSNFNSIGSNVSGIGSNVSGIGSIVNICLSVIARDLGHLLVQFLYNLIARGLPIAIGASLIKQLS